MCIALDWGNFMRVVEREFTVRYARENFHDELKARVLEVLLALGIQTSNRLHEMPLEDLVV